MNKLFLIDAYALIYRAYYAFINSPRINSKGMNTSCVMGFCNTLNEVLTKEKPTHIAVAFDHGKTFRHEAFPAYKAQRQETPEDIRASVPVIKDVLNAMRIPVITADGFEADDIIGTIAHTADLQGIDCFMLTPDKDYAQLVTPRVKMYRPRHGGGYEVMGEKEVCEKYGIDSTAKVIDLLGLMGDSSDNYPGCPGVGEKTAAKLINQFGSIENLLDSTTLLKGKMREKVEAAVEDIKMSKFLATIRTDVPLTISIDEMKVVEPDELKVREIFAELEFKSLADRMFKKSAESKKSVNSQLSLFENFATDGQEIEKTSSLSSFQTSNAKYHLIENEEDAARLAELLVTKQIVSFDTETTSLSPIDAELVGMSFAFAEKEAFYVAVPAEFEKAQKIVNIFEKFWNSTNITKVGQNCKYDIEVLRKYGVEVKAPLWDTMIAHYLINPGRENNMDSMAETLLNYQTIHIEELIGPKGPRQKSMRDLAPSEVCNYAAEDADITLQLKNVLEPKLKECGAEQLFYEIEMPLVPVLADMELEGVALDTESLNQVREKFNSRMLELEHEIYELAGGSFNIASPKQVGEVLFEKLQIMEKAKKTKTGQYQTSEEVLQSLRAKHPIVEKILEHRGLKKLIGTYVDALPKLINPRTGHIHTSFNQCVTTTGRLSSSDPNLQNIPIRDDNGKEIRKCITAPLLLPPSGGGLEVTTENSWGAQPVEQTNSYLEQESQAVNMQVSGLRSADPILYEKLKNFSQENRNNMTEAETLLWNYLKSDNLGVRFRRQHIIECFITDFICLKARLVVEMDGGYHDVPEQKEYDEYRTQRLKELGFREIRFKNEDVFNNLDSVIQTIKENLESQLSNLTEAATKDSLLQQTEHTSVLPLKGGARGGLRALFFSADYSQIELRVMASMSGDEGMIKAFSADADIHAATASKVFKKPVEEITKDERSKAKRANFGIIYGISAFGLAQNMGIERAEAKALIDGYFEAFPGVKKFMEESKQRVAEKGYAETLYGRRRYLPDITSRNATVRAIAERNAINAPIQGTAADIIKIAMIRIHKRMKEEGLRSKMILQVHDELNFSVVPEEKFHVKQLVLEEMQNAAALRVPLIAESGFGNNWLEAH